MLVILGATGMGTAVKFIPRPVVIGFTNGIAVLIASTQIKDFFGLQLAKVPGEFLAAHEGARRHAPTWSLRGHAAGRRHGGGDAAVPRHLERDSRARSSRCSAATLAASFCKLPVETVGHAVRRHSQRPAAFRDPAIPCRTWSTACSTGLHRGDARRHRVADVGRGRRPHEQRPAQSQCRTGRPGHRQHRLAAVRRLAGDRRHRPHRHQHPLRRADRRSRA